MNFEQHIQGTKPVLVIYYAEWCHLCQLMIPVLQRINEMKGDMISLFLVKIDENKRFAKKYNVFALPTLILLHQSQVLWRKNGIAPESEILEQLNLRAA